VHCMPENCRSSIGDSCNRSYDGELKYQHVDACSMDRDDRNMVGDAFSLSWELMSIM
jgi:hypothetical protein